VFPKDDAVEADLSSKLTSRKLTFVSTLGWFLASSVPVSAQDAPQPSVADAARAARKDKDKSKDKDAAAPKTVITDENLSTGVGTAPASASSKLADANPSAGGPSGSSSSLDPAWARLQATEASLDRLDPLGPTELARTVLNGNTAGFPNRGDWEEKLYSAKGIYIQRSRQLIAAMKQVLADTEALQSSGQGKITDNDPRVQALTRKSQQIMQLAARTESAFQSVITEGQNLALSAPR
jgi:hypothetical protein